MPVRRRATSEEQKEARRRSILEAARALLQETTFEAVSMAAVARQAGLAKGTVYLYFRSAPCKGTRLQWVRVPPGNWSLQPVAIGAAVEVTRLPKPSRKRSPRAICEHAGRSANER